MLPDLTEWPRTAAGCGGAALGTLFGGLVLGALRPGHVVFVSGTVALALVTALLLLANLAAWVLNDYEEVRE